MKLSEIAAFLKAEMPAQAKGDPDIKALATIQDARAGDISFVSNSDYERFVGTTQATALIVGRVFENCPALQIVTKNPYLSYARLAQKMYPATFSHKGISPQAIIGERVKMGSEVAIYPFVHIGHDVKLGDHVRIMSGVTIGDRCTIGANTLIYPGTVIYDDTEIGSNVIIHSNCVVGADGFGFAVGEGAITKIPQIGRVVIENDVELGALCTIDRAALGETRIGRGTKFDDKVHIAHNVRVGENCLFAALVGIAGSTEIGSWVMIGGHSGAAGHLKIADQTTIGGMSGVISSTEGKQTYVGFPAMPQGEWRRSEAIRRNLPALDKRLKSLESQLKSVQEELMKLTNETSKGHL